MSYVVFRYTYRSYIRLMLPVEMSDGESLKILFIYSLA